MNLVFIMILLLARIINPVTARNAEHYPLISGTLCEDVSGHRFAHIVVKSWKNGIEGQNSDIAVGYITKDSEFSEWSENVVVYHGEFTEDSYEFSLTVTVPIAYDIMFNAQAIDSWGDGDTSQRLIHSGLQWIGKCKVESTPTATSTVTPTPTSTITPVAVKTIATKIPDIVLTQEYTETMTATPIVTKITPTIQSTPTISATATDEGSVGPPPVTIIPTIPTIVATSTTTGTTDIDDSDEPARYGIYLPSIFR
jgi:hypothetical protein